MNKKKFVSLILLLTFIASTSVVVNASSKRLWLASHVEQSKTLWCWAAASQMMGEHYNMSNYKTQSEIVDELHGNTNNETCGGTEELVEAVEYSTGINNSWFCESKWKVQQPHIGFTRTKEEINSNTPYLVSTITHVVFIRGYDEYIDGLDEVEKVYVSDPLKPYAVWLDYDQVTSPNTIVIERI